LVDQLQLVASAVCVRDLIVDDTEPVAFDAREASMEASLDLAGQVEAGLDDVTRS